MILFTLYGSDCDSFSIRNARGVDLSDLSVFQTLIHSVSWRSFRTLFIQTRQEFFLQMVQNTIDTTLILGLKFL